MTYLALCANYWGKGETVEAAKAEMKRQGGNLKSYAVYQMPEGATEVWVDDFGRARWTWAEGADTDGQPVEVKSVHC